MFKLNEKFKLCVMYPLFTQKKKSLFKFKFYFLHLLCRLFPLPFFKRRGQRGGREEEEGKNRILWKLNYTATHAGIMRNWGALGKQKFVQCYWKRLWEDLRSEHESAFCCHNVTVQWPYYHFKGLMWNGNAPYLLSQQVKPGRPQKGIAQE